MYNIYSINKSSNSKDLHLPISPALSTSRQDTTTALDFPALLLPFTYTPPGTPPNGKPPPSIDSSHLDHYDSVKMAAHLMRAWDQLDEAAESLAKASFMAKPRDAKRIRKLATAAAALRRRTLA